MYPVLIAGLVGLVLWLLVLMAQSGRARPKDTIDGFRRALDALAPTPSSRADDGDEPVVETDTVGHRGKPAHS